MHGMIRFNKSHYKYSSFSNFYPCEIQYDGNAYTSSEAAWQSLKTMDSETRKEFVDLSPASAKKRGRRVKLREDWEEVKYPLMIDVCYTKFSQNENIRQILLSTGDEILEEDTTGWHDNEWGNCRCVACKNIEGKNLLGKALMVVRKELSDNHDGNSFRERIQDMESLDTESKKIVFCTHNNGKVQSANKYFDGEVLFETVDYEITEIRGTIEEIAIAKVKEAYSRTGKPTIAMDAGFEVDAINGFPGPYVNHMLETIGIEGVLKLMEGVTNRDCRFTQCLAYYDGKSEPIVFHGRHVGIIADEKKGVLSEDDWSDISLIFIPEEEVNGKKRTLAEMNHEERIQLTRKNDDGNHSAFKAFKEWFVDR